MVTIFKLHSLTRSLYTVYVHIFSIITLQVMKNKTFSHKGIEKQNKEHFTFFRKLKIKTFQRFLLTHQNKPLTLTARSLEPTDFQEATQNKSGQQ